jgi:hypothetical protein
MIDGSLKKGIVSCMNFLRSTAVFVGASIMLMALSVPSSAQPENAEATSFQKKATEAQARIQANKDDRDQLMAAVKKNEMASAKQVLLRNGFTAEDLENAHIILRTGGGKKGQGEFEISARCCDPKEITIQRSLDYFIK